MSAIEYSPARYALSPSWRSIDSVQAIDFLRITLDAIGHGFGCEGPKVMGLARYRPEAADLPEQPSYDAAPFF